MQKSARHFFQKYVQKYFLSLRNLHRAGPDEKLRFFSAPVFPGLMFQIFMLPIKMSAAININKTWNFQGRFKNYFINNLEKK